jgi:adenosine deaminase
LSRHFGAEAAMGELQSLLANRHHFVALDLAGDEANFPGGLFVEYFKIAGEASWQITVHAGEAAGAEHLAGYPRSGSHLIGHCVRALDDPALVEHMLEHRIGIEANLTSNMQTSTVTSYADHPLKARLKAGLLATINTDDPGISSITLAYEYEYAAPIAGLNREHVRQAQVKRPLSSIPARN